MAASDKLKISIFGQGAHAAEPQNGIDAIMIATQVVNAINSFRARTMILLSLLFYLWVQLILEAGII